MSQLRNFDFSTVSTDCVKCGKCIPTCTIHQVHPDETTSPRGFLHLLGAYQNGALELDRDAKGIFESCFLCTNCVDVCPGSLPTDRMIEEVRADIADKYGIAWYKRMFFWLLRHRKTMDLMARLGYTFKACGVKSVPEKRSILPRFKLPIIGGNRLLPGVSGRSFLNTYPENMSFGDKRRVAVFIGCMANYSYTEIGDSLLYILKKLEIDAFIPKGQLCCGAPAWFTGDVETVEYLIKKNVEYFETWFDDVEAIVIPEATCSSMIIHDWARVLDKEPEWVRRVEKIVKKCFIATEWLYKYTPLEKVLAEKGKQNFAVTYHDPCHARKTQGVWKEPRNLLKQNYEIREMSDPNRCCGFGGVTMQTEKYHYAKAAGKPKAEMIGETGARIVSAECSACRMQLTDALYQEGVDVTFKNPLELIAEALR